MVTRTFFGGVVGPGVVAAVLRRSMIKRWFPDGNLNFTDLGRFFVTVSAASNAAALHVTALNGLTQANVTILVESAGLPSQFVAKVRVAVSVSANP